MRAVAGEDDDLDRVILHRPVERGVEIVGHLQILRVARFGPVHHDPRNARLGPFHQQGLELHGALAFPSFLLAAMLLCRRGVGKGASAAKTARRHSGMVRRTRPGISTGFDASHRPGMTTTNLHTP